MIRLLALALCAAALPATAAGVKTPEELARIRAGSRYENLTWPMPTLSLVPRLGVAAGDLGGLTYAAGLEVAYAPAFEKRLSFAVATSWQPSSANSRYSGWYTVRVDELDAAVLARYHGYSPSARIAPFASLGAGFAARRAATHFAGVGTRTERELRPAGFVGAGLAILAGHGAVEVEARADYAPSNTIVMKGSSNVPYSLTVGYRFTLR